MLALPNPTHRSNNPITCNNRLSSVLLGTILALLTAGMSASAYAKNYQVEAIVFKQVDAGSATESHRYTPPSEPRSPAETWVVEPRLLEEELAALTASANYQVIQRFSWSQESLPYSESASMSFYEPSLKGWIKVYANSLLYVNLDLEVDGFRLTEKRRIKLDEKHFFDHPKIGVLLQVSRLEDESLEDATDAAQNAPLSTQ